MPRARVGDVSACAPSHRCNLGDLERTALAAAEITRLGAGAICTEPGLVAKVSSDWSRMSPVLQEKIPPGHYLADVVVRPTEPEQVPVILKVAFDHDVPVTPRGAGTGNYGQATPFDGGILLDLRDLRSITVNDGGTITADASAPLTEIDKVARAAAAISGSSRRRRAPPSAASSEAAAPGPGRSSTARRPTGSSSP